MKETRQIGYHTAFLSMYHGLSMDSSMAAYLVIPIILFLLLSIFLPFFRKPLTYQIYTGLLLLFLLFLIIADLGIYNAWGFRLDATPLKYIKTPKEAWASIQHLPLLRGAIIFIIIWICLLLPCIRVIKKASNNICYGNNKIKAFISLLLLTGLFIIPMRGGLQLSPINQSSVYFSPDNFANQAAINATWNLMYSLNHAVENTSNPYLVMPMKEAELITDSLYQRSGAHESFIDLQKTPSPNVIIIIWESFTRKVIDAERDGVYITPGFNKLKNEGIYFSNIYASGDRTDKGLAAVLSGYPAQHQNSIIKVPGKARKLPMLSKEFFNKNYSTSFYYGGETEFANMKAYLMQGSFQNFVSINDFKKRDQNSKWGAHDEVVMNRMYDDLVKMKSPFFATWLTLSSHEPFEVPAATVIPGDDEEDLFLNSLHYTDSVLYNFIQKCKIQPWWNNTIIVISPDHGKPLPRTLQKQDEFKTSLLILGGALNKSVVINRLGSQVDIASTLLGQLAMPSTSFRWSRDLTDTTAKPWAFFAFNNGFGFIQPSLPLVYDNTGNRPIGPFPAGNENTLRAGKALQQVLHQDYLDK